MVFKIRIDVFNALLGVPVKPMGFYQVPLASKEWGSISWYLWFPLQQEKVDAPDALILWARYANLMCFIAVASMSVSYAWPLSKTHAPTLGNSCHCRWTMEEMELRRGREMGAELGVGVMGQGRADQGRKVANLAAASPAKL